VDSVDDHKEWLVDVEETQGAKVNYPLIADKERKVATLYGMLDANPTDDQKDAKGLPVTVRSVFIIDANRKVRFIATYPPSCGRNLYLLPVVLCCATALLTIPLVELL
jgi:alkyl hydroperoxide reductase subunit AhpC